MSKIECPYCEKEIEEPDECNDPGETYSHQCPECNKVFQFTVDYTKEFYPTKADCLNGAEHDYQPITCGAPEWYFRGKRRCTMCGEQIQLEPPVPPTYIIVNGKSHMWDRPDMTINYDGICALAGKDPGQSPTITVDYRDLMPSRALVRGECAMVMDHMVINCMVTGNA